MINKSLWKRVQEKLFQEKVPVKVQQKIFKKLNRDLILPILNLRANCRVNVQRDTDSDINLYIGPRDWAFTKNGVCIGAGTLLL